jgi:hypothetical protein
VRLLVIQALLLPLISRMHFSFIDRYTPPVNIHELQLPHRISKWCDSYHTTQRRSYPVDGEVTSLYIVTTDENPPHSVIERRSGSTSRGERGERLQMKRYGL